MYLDINTIQYGAVMFGFAISFAVACVQSGKAKRLGEDLRKKTFEAESFQLASMANEQRLGAEKLAHAQTVERCTKLETALRESEDTGCRLRQELQTAYKKANELGAELDAATQAHDACIRNLWSARSEVDDLREECRKLEEALSTERESAEHWREEHKKEQLWRMSTEGHILRELHNILNYDGSAHGQEELEE